MILKLYSAVQANVQDTLLMSCLPSALHHVIMNRNAGALYSPQTCFVSSSYTDTAIKNRRLTCLRMKKWRYSLCHSAVRSRVTGCHSENEPLMILSRGVATGTSRETRLPQADVRPDRAELKGDD